MSAPSLTFDGLKALGPCEERFAVAKKKIGGPRKWNGKQVTAAQARELGMSFDDIVWVASAIARSDADVERRLRLWMTDCAARVLHIYEKHEDSEAPRNAIIAARQYARGETDEAAWAAAGAAAGAARAAEAAARAAWAAGAAWAARAAWAAARAAWAAGAAGAARAAARAAEQEWQFDRLIGWLSENEPTDYPLPQRQKVAA